MWGEELTCEADVWNVFYAYVSGQPNSSGNIVSNTLTYPKVPLVYIKLS